MKSFILTLSFALLIVSCAQTQKNTLAIPVGEKTPPSPHEAVATFGEGCFWHSEIIFQSLVGVRDAVSGFAGGHSKNPSYEEVSSGGTGYAECVQVYYDPAKVSYETLVKAFFASHDPTQLNRQGPDEGPQYRSIAFYRNANEKQILENELKRISATYPRKVVTEVVPFTTFYPAEDYHQEYVFHHPENPYVQHVSIPEYVSFRKTFKGNFKQ